MVDPATEYVPIDWSPDRADAEEAATPPRLRRVISSRYIHRRQLTHFGLLNVAPHLVAVLAIVSCVWIPVGWPEAVSIAAMWMVTGLGITVGYHRLFTHKSFEATPLAEILLVVAGSMAGQGGVISWAATHRRHHQMSDRDGDPHSPNTHGRTVTGVIRGLAHSHFLWMRKHDYPNPSYYAKDLLRKRHLAWVNARYYLWVGLGIALPAVAVALMRQSWTGLISGALWGGAVRIVILGNTIWAINSILHVTGTRDFDTRDFSGNSALFGLVTFGESFHHNHHAFPRSASFGLGKAWLDPGYWAIRLLSVAGLAKNPLVPDREVIARRRAISLNHELDGNLHVSGR